MRHIITLITTGVMILSTGTANADLGDQLFKLLPDDGAAGDWFGWSIAISGETAIIGAWENDDNGEDSGSVYLFDATMGQQLFKLLPRNGEMGDRFGISVAISGTTAIVGADHDDDNGTYSGSAYLFDTTTGQQLFKLLPNDAAAYDQFGYSVAISGDTAIVGAIHDDVHGYDSGSAYLFDTTTGQQLFRLIPNDGSISDYFGCSVAISGTTAIVGAYNDDDNGKNSGSAYLFDTTTGQQIAKLLPNDGALNDSFGYSNAISGDTAIVGAWHHDDNGLDSGSAYLFDTTTGLQIAKLLPNDGARNDWFGRSVAISPDGIGTAIVGAIHDDDNGSNSGSAYLFDISDPKIPAQIAKLLPDDGAEWDFFGFSVAISGITAIVSVINDDDNGLDSGSAYLFDAGRSSGTIATLTSFGIDTGVLLDGALGDLESSDDSYIHTRSGFGSTLVDLHNMEMIVNAVTTVDAASTIDLTIESRIDEPAGLAQIRLRNWNTTQFESVGSYSIGNTDNVDEVLGIDAANYVDGSGNIDLSIKNLVFVPFLAFTFESFIDQVEIVVVE